MQNNPFSKKYLDMFVTALPKCALCKRYQLKNSLEVCEAFPDGIPEDVIWDPFEKECNNSIFFEEAEE